MERGERVNAPSVGDTEVEEMGLGKCLGLLRDWDEIGP